MERNFQLSDLNKIFIPEVVDCYIQWSLNPNVSWPDDIHELPILNEKFDCVDSALRAIEQKEYGTTPEEAKNFILVIVQNKVIKNPFTNLEENYSFRK